MIGNPLQHEPQIRRRIHPIELRRTNQGIDRRSPFPARVRSGE
jgi:hypothetical protein